MTQRFGGRQAVLDEKVSQLRAITERVEEDLLAARHLIEGILDSLEGSEQAYSQPWQEWLNSAAACHDDLVRLADAVDRASPSR